MTKEFEVTYSISVVIEANSKKEAERTFYETYATELVGVATHELKIKKVEQ